LCCYLSKKHIKVENRIFCNTLLAEKTLVTADKNFKKMFPHLAKELSAGENAVSIDSVEPTHGEILEKKPDKFHNYVPTVIDFIQRCDTEEEAHEIIVYMEKRYEITKEEAQQLEKQLKKKGVRSFGAKKEDYYYFKQSGFY
jgi:hypothetical protein